jgi:predicted CopG family antitoxin
MTAIEELARELQEIIQGGASISDIIELLTKESQQREGLYEQGFTRFLLNKIKRREQIEELKEKHEAIRTVLMNNDCEEYGDCIIDEICEAIGILPTTVYYIDGE